MCFAYLIEFIGKEWVDVVTWIIGSIIYIAVLLPLVFPKPWIIDYRWNWYSQTHWRISNTSNFLYHNSQLLTSHNNQPILINHNCSFIRVESLNNIYILCPLEEKTNKQTRQTDRQTDSQIKETKKSSGADESCLLFKLKLFVANYTDIKPTAACSLYASSMLVVECVGTSSCCIFIILFNLAITQRAPIHGVFVKMSSKIFLSFNPHYGWFLFIYCSKIEDGIRASNWTVRSLASY